MLQSNYAEEGSSLSCGSTVVVSAGLLGLQRAHCTLFHNLPTISRVKLQQQQKICSGKNLFLCALK